MSKGSKRRPQQISDDELAQRWALAFGRKDMTYEHNQARKAGWTGDLNDDCFLERYGMFAHAEAMGRRVWWFCISDGRGAGREQLYNSADCMTSLPLTSGAKARCAAECVMECLLKTT